MKQKESMSQPQCPKAGPWTLEGGINIKPAAGWVAWEGLEVPAGFWVLQIRCSSLDVRHYLDLDKVRLFLELTFVQPQLVSTEIFGFRLLRRVLLPKQTFSFSWLRGLHAAIVTSPFGLISMTPLMCVCVLLGESEFFMFSMFHTSLGRKISACWWFAFLLRFWWGSKSGRQWAPNTRGRSDWGKVRNRKWYKVELKVLKDSWTDVLADGIHIFRL